MIVKRGNRFFTNSPDFLLDEHYLNDNLINAVIDLESNLIDSLRITSSFRTPKHNKKVGGVKGSHHLTGSAIDFQFNVERQECLVQVYHWLYARKDLYAVGELRLYDKYIHLSCVGQFEPVDKRLNRIDNSDLVFKPVNKFNPVVVIIGLFLLIYYSVRK